MREYNLDSIEYQNYPPEFIQYTIKKLLNDNSFFESDEQALLYKPYLFAHCLSKIKNETQLNNTIDLYKSGGWLKKEKIATQYLIENVLYKLIYSKEDCTKIKAIVYSGMMEYEILIKTYKSIIKRDIPEFKFEVKDRIVKINSDELYDFVVKEFKKSFYEQIKKLPALEDQRILINKLIKSMIELDWNNHTNYYDKDRALLNDLRNTLSIDDVNSEYNKHLTIFTQNGFELFNYLMNNTIEKKGEWGQFSSISYYYRKMKKNEVYIHAKIEPFLTWFNKNYEDYIDHPITKITLTDSYKDTGRDKLYGYALDLFK
jgi:hypothetical protein